MLGAVSEAAGGDEAIGYRRAYPGHAADADEIQDVAENLCTAASWFALAGTRALAARLVGQAARVVELRADPRRARPHLPAT